MPAIYFKYKLGGKIPVRTMQELVNALPLIVSRALDVTKEDIQVWGIPPDPFDVNLKELQLAIPIHAYPERVKNLEARKELIITAIRSIVGSHEPHVGWVWIQPSSDTALGRI